MLVKEKVEKQFNAMSYSHRKEWMLWLNDAKKEETRMKRMNKAIEKLKEKSGK